MDKLIQIYKSIKLIFLALIQLINIIGPFFTAIIVYLCTDSILATIANYILCILLTNIYLLTCYKNLYNKISNFNGTYKEFLNNYTKDHKLSKTINSFNFDICLFYVTINVFLMVFVL